MEMIATATVQLQSYLAHHASQMETRGGSLRFISQVIVAVKKNYILLPNKFAVKPAASLFPP